MDKEKSQQIEKLWGRYKRLIFEGLNFTFVPGKRVLDLGCGSGEDAVVLRDVYGLKTSATDVYEHEDLKKLNINFKKGSIYTLPYEDKSFDYVFLHDVLHHIDEEEQRFEKHLNAMREIKRVTKKMGYIVIVEGNRYNPLFYPHMVKMLGHDHFTQNYFKKLVNESFSNVRFSAFEAHVYPKKWMWFWKIYESLMERFSPKRFLAYNVAIIQV